MKCKRSFMAIVTAAVASVPLGLTARAGESSHLNMRNKVRHVLLLSIDGMHAVDYLNCSNGGLCPNLAALGQTGFNFVNTTTSRPSDSFPGLMALVTGGSPRTVGAYYDVAYDRVLAPPTQTTWNGLAGGACTSGQPNGTTTEYEERIDLDPSKLNGGASSGDGGINSIDSTRLIRDPYNNCRPVYPWNFIRTNTIFGVVHNAGGYTAWSDKHPAYSAVSGPGDGTNVDDYYSPEINSNIVALTGVTTPEGFNCGTLTPSTKAWSDDFTTIKCYDTLKVDAILHEIDGKTHNGLKSAPVPAVFGMNFQAVSVGQKLIEKNVGTGGYQDSIGTPTPALKSEIKFVDDSVGEMVAELKKQGLLSSTLIIVTAKHGQSPIDPSRYFRIPADNASDASPAEIIANNTSYLPFSESPNNPTGIGPTEDDVSLLWLNDPSETADAVSVLQSMSPPANNIAGIGEIFSGPQIAQFYNSPGVPPNDPRTPDIIVTPNIGVIYTGSHKKLAEHGGFAHDDTNVMMLVSNPRLSAVTVSTFVQTAQVAPTILEALGLNPSSLQAVKMEGTQPLPELFGN
jgi:hypothetical protein